MIHDVSHGLPVAVLPAHTRSYSNEKDGLTYVPVLYCICQLDLSGGGGVAPCPLMLKCGSSFAPIVFSLLVAVLRIFGILGGVEKHSIVLSRELVPSFLYIYTYIYYFYFPLICVLPVSWRSALMPRTRVRL
jgi:hypothetical protein